MLTQDQTFEYLKGIYSLYDGEELPPEIREDVESEVGLIIFQGVIVSSAVLLDEHKNKELEIMFDTDKEMHEIIHFLEREIHEFDLLIKDIGSIVMKNLKEVN